MFIWILLFSALLQAAPIGHEYRQEDWPALAAAPDGSIWAAWLSFDGTRDDVAIRRYHNNQWSNLQWVPGTSGDSWAPQIAVDRNNGVWVVWPQQAGGNWDIYARRFDPAKQAWGALERLTNHPLPDMNPRLATNGKGQFALVWQGFREHNSNIFLKTFDGEKWSAEVRVTKRAANDWDPAVALDSKGTAWVAYDSYKNGNYDVFLSQVRGGVVQGSEIPVAVTPRFEARASVAVDTTDRVWVAWETRLANWGKDQGYILRGRQQGALLVAGDSIKLRCYESGRWREPAASLAQAIPGLKPYAPQVFSDGAGSVWVVAYPRKSVGDPHTPQDGYTPSMERGNWEFWATHLEGSAWSKAALLPESGGRLSLRASGVMDGAGNFWAAWPTDSRDPRVPGRPIRQQVFADKIAGAVSAGPPVLKTPVDEPIDAAIGHRDEAADVRAIRSYSATVGGKPLRILRGDFHRHTELSWDLGGNTDGSLLDFYRYMIDAAAMDFGASTDHQGGGGWPYWWWYTQKMTDMFHAPGAYVPIYGYERSVVFPNGHRNVFFAKRSEARVTPFFLAEGEKGFGLPIGPQGSEPGSQGALVAANDTKLLYEDVRARNGIVIPHSTGTNQGTDWRDNDPLLEPVVEIFQGSRMSYEQEGAPHTATPAKDAVQMKMTGHQPSGMVSAAWGKGYRLGVIASSDHFSTHLSYAMVYTDDPTRQGILSAMRKRHTYGATDNIILDVRSGEHFMGDEFTLARTQPIAVKIRGTGPLSQVDVIKDSKVVYSTNPLKPAAEFQFVDKDAPSGRHYYYVRVLQADGMIAWSSPMFIQYK